MLNPALRRKKNSSPVLLVGRSAVSPTSSILSRLRNDFGLSQGLIVRLSGFSPRAIANWEGGSKATEPAVRKFSELQRLFEAIAALTKDRREVADWMQQPNPAFDGSSPLQVIERGETDRLWRMIYYLESGEPG
jgi:transcriptional regulator with XRE-family HTH domain